MRIALLGPVQLSLLARELGVVPGSEELHQLIAVRGEITRRHIPRGPGRSGVLTVLGGVGHGHANPVAAEHDHQLQVGIAACGRSGRVLCRSQRGERERSQGDEENSNGSAHVIVRSSQRKV